MHKVDALSLPYRISDGRLRRAIETENNINVLAFKYVGDTINEYNSPASSFTAPIGYTFDRSAYTIEHNSDTNKDNIVLNKSIYLTVGNWWVNFIVKTNVPLKYFNSPNKYRYLEDIGTTFKGGWYKLNKLRGTRVSDNDMFNSAFLIGSGKINAT